MRLKYLEYCCDAILITAELLYREKYKRGMYHVTYVLGLTCSGRFRAFVVLKSLIFTYQF